VKDMRIWIIIIPIVIIFVVLCVSLLGIFVLETENVDELSLIYTNSNYSEAKYSGTTKEKAQHLVEMINGSWKQGCEENDGCFLPKIKTIGVGNSVLFLNKDDFEHNVRVRGDSDYLHFPTDVIKTNEYFVNKFSNSGTYNYYCTLHPWMEGKIIVTE